MLIEVSENRRRQYRLIFCIKWFVHQIQTQDRRGSKAFGWQLSKDRGDFCHYLVIRRDRKVKKRPSFYCWESILFKLVAIILKFFIRKRVIFKIIICIFPACLISTLPNLQQKRSLFRKWFISFFKMRTIFCWGNCFSYFRIENLYIRRKNIWLAAVCAWPLQRTLFLFNLRMLLLFDLHALSPLWAVIEK